MATELTIDFENLMIYEIDSDDYGECETSRKLLDEINSDNDQFITEKLVPSLLSRCAPCSCRMQEIAEREIRKAQLLGRAPSPNIALTQEDVDAYKFGVVLTMEKGRYTKINLIVRTCKKCKDIHFWGEGDVFTKLMAEAFTRMADIEKSKESEDPESEIANDQNNELLSSMGLDPNEYELETIE